MSNARFPSINPPDGTFDGLQTSVRQIKDTVEQLTNQFGPPETTAVLWGSINDKRMGDLYGIPSGVTVLYPESRQIPLGWARSLVANSSITGLVYIEKL